jgi:hypothetical protein
MGKVEIDPKGFLPSPQKQTGREIDSPLPVNHVLSAAQYAHINSPVQKTGDLDAYVDHAKKINETYASGGGTIPSSPGSDPLPAGPGTDWYGVGHAMNYAAPGGPEGQQGWLAEAGSGRDALPAVTAQVFSTEANNIERAKHGRDQVYTGGWTRKANDMAEREKYGPSINVMDQTDITQNKNQAAGRAIARGEDAFFGSKDYSENYVPKAPKRDG